MRRPVSFRLGVTLVKSAFICSSLDELSPREGNFSELKTKTGHDYLFLKQLKCLGTL